MAVYFTDFSEYTTGATSLADWSDIWLSGDDPLIIAVADFVSPYPASTKALEMTKVDSIRSCYSWEDITTIGSCEVLAKIALPAASGYGSSFWLCASGRKGKETGYNVVFNGSYCGVFKFDGGTQDNTSIGPGYLDLPNSPTIGDLTDLWIRFLYDSSTGAMKLKIWKPTQDEPTYWTWEDTDVAPLTSGVFGIGDSQAGTCQWEYLKISTGTDIPATYTPLTTAFEWGSVYYDASSRATCNGYSFWYGGTWNKVSKAITALKLKMSIYHTEQVRIAIYEGTSLAVGPDGATLLEDLGQTSGSDVSTMISLTVDSLQIDSGTFIWIAIKGNTYNAFAWRVGDEHNHGDFDFEPGCTVLTADGNIGTDVSVAFPSTTSISYQLRNYDVPGLTLVYEDAPSGEDIISIPGKGDLTITGYAPVAYGGAPDMSIGKGNLFITGYSPVVIESYSWSTDFSEYTTGSFPSDWTDVFTSITNGSEIVAYSGDGAIGLKSFWTEALVDLGAGKYWHTWDTPGVLTDFEALALVHKDFDSIPPLPITFRMSGGVTDFTGYQLGLDGSLRKYVDGISSSTFENSYISYLAGYPSNGASTPDQHWWTRLKVVGGTFYVKTWHVTQHEPLQWSRVYYDDDPILSGKVGISGTISGGNDWYTEYFAVAVNKPPLQIPSQPTNFDRSMWGVSYCYFGYANSGGDTFRLSGGVWELEGQEITGFDIQNSDYHSTQARLAVYVSYEPLIHLIENDAKVTPDDAVLLCELGLTTGTTIDDRFHADLGTPVRIPNGVTYLWIAVKANSGFGIAGTDAYPAVPSNFDSHNDAWVYDSGVSFDTSVAFPNDLSAASGGHRLVDEGHVPCAIHISPIALVQLASSSSAQSIVPDPSASLNPASGFAVRSYAQSKTETKEGVVDFIVTDFSEYDNGNASVALTDWSYLVLEESPTIAVTETPTIITSPSSGKVLVTPNTSDYREEIITWDKIGIVKDFDLVLKTTLNYGDTFIAFRHNGLSAIMSEYYYWEFSYLSVNLARKNHGTLGIDRWSSVFFNYGQYIDVWVRVRAEGNVLQIKIWPGDQFEPADWTDQITDADTDYYSDKQANITTPGLVGIGGQSYVNEIDIMAVAIEGKTVPFPPIGSVLDSSEWGSDTSGGSPSAIDSTYVQGGAFPAEEYDRVLKAVKVKAGTVTGDIRIAVYSGGSLADGPDGATLLYDFGVQQLISSGWSEYFCNSVLVPEDQPVWVAWKSTDSVPVYRDSSTGSAGNFQKDHGAFIISDGVDPDADTPWPTTIDVTSGAYDDAVKYYHQFMLQFDKKWVPEELFITGTSAAISYTNSPDALLQTGLLLDVTSSAQSLTNTPDATSVGIAQVTASSTAQSLTNTPEAIASTAISLTSSASATTSTNDVSPFAVTTLTSSISCNSNTSTVSTQVACSPVSSSTGVSSTTDTTSNVKASVVAEAAGQSLTSDAPGIILVGITSSSDADTSTTNANGYISVQITSSSDADASTNAITGQTVCSLLNSSDADTSTDDVVGSVLVGATSSSSAESITSNAIGSVVVSLLSSSDAESITSDVETIVNIILSNDSSAISDTSSSIGSVLHKLALQSDPESFTNDVSTSIVVNPVAISGSASSTSEVQSLLTRNISSDSTATSLTSDSDGYVSASLETTASASANSSTSVANAEMSARLEISCSASAQSETSGATASVSIYALSSSDATSVTSDCETITALGLDTEAQSHSLTNTPEAFTQLNLLSDSGAESSTNDIAPSILTSLTLTVYASTETNAPDGESKGGINVSAIVSTSTNEIIGSIKHQGLATSNAESYTNTITPTIDIRLSSVSDAESLTNEVDPSAGVLLISSSDAETATTTGLADVSIVLESHSDSDTLTNGVSPDVLVSIISISDGESFTCDVTANLLLMLDSYSDAESLTGECGSVLISGILSSSIAESFTNIVDGYTVARLDSYSDAESFTSSAVVNVNHLLEALSDGASITGIAESYISIGLEVSPIAVSYTGDTLPVLTNYILCLSIGRSYTNLINGTSINNLTGEGLAVSNTNIAFSLVSVVSGYVDGDSFVRTAPSLEYRKLSETICR